MKIIFKYCYFEVAFKGSSKILGEFSSKIDTLLLPFFLPLVFFVVFDVDAPPLATASKDRYSDAQELIHAYSSILKNHTLL